ncbi:hypothetical protein COJ85_25880, partial [Bacillus sp. AFS076308]
ALGKGEGADLVHRVADRVGIGEFERRGRCIEQHGLRQLIFVAFEVGARTFSHRGACGDGLAVVARHQLQRFEPGT